MCAACLDLSPDARIALGILIGIVATMTALAWFVVRSLAWAAREEEAQWPVPVDKVSA